MEKFPKNINKSRDFILLTKHRSSAEGRFLTFKYDFGEPKVCRPGASLQERRQKKPSADMCKRMDVSLLTERDWRKGKKHLTFKNVRTG